MKKKLRRLLVLLLLPTALTACGPNEPDLPAPVTELPFSAPAESLLPFFCLGQDGCLWQITSNGAFSLKKTAEAVVGGKTLFFARLQGDGIVFASDFQNREGVDHCTVYYWADGTLTQWAEDALYDSLRLAPDGSLLYIDGSFALFCRRNGMKHHIADDVAQAEPLQEGTFLYRLKSGHYEDGEFVYPVYYATVDFRNYLMEAAEIKAVDETSGLAFLIKGKHTVQKRSAFAEVATCFVCAEGEILYEVASVPLVQLKNGTAPWILLSCREDQPTLVYRLYRMIRDGVSLISETCVDGRDIGGNFFAYETLENGRMTIGVLHRDNVVKPRYVSGETVSLKQLYGSNGAVFAFFDCRLHELADGFPAVSEEVNAVQRIGDDLLLLKEKSAPYSVIVFRNGQSICLTSDAADARLTYADGFLYYYTGESGAYHLSMVDDRGVETAYISQVNDAIGFAAEGTTVAAAKMEDNHLYLAGPWGIVDTHLPIKQFIKGA